MSFPTLLMLSLLTLGAQPDKFWLAEPDAKAVEGSSPRLIEGVLLDQTETQYHVRVEGGEVWLDKKAVVKVDKDALTVEQIATAEQQGHEHRLAEQRADAKAAEAAAREASAMPAAAHKSDAAAPAPAVDTAQPMTVLPGHYDPVLDTYVPGPGPTNAELQRDLEFAYEETRDRNLIKLIRMMRRMY